MKTKSAILFAATALASCLVSEPASATVTTAGWWHYGEVSDYYADSSGNNYRFQSAFSSGHNGNADAQIVPFGAGGPLGKTGFTSTASLLWGSDGLSASGMWDPGNTTVPSYNPPSTNYGIELWMLPVGTGVLPLGRSTSIFDSGENGGVEFVVTDNGDGTSTITAQIVATSITIGDPLPLDTNRWTHLAIVNDAETLTFYVNGVQHGAPNLNDATVPAGNIFAGSSPGTTPTYDGYLDELRIFTFAPGAFSTNDLLLRTIPGPNIIAQPPSESVWNGGAAPIDITVAFDLTVGYQWNQSGTPIAGANSSELYMPLVGLTNSGSVFNCVLTNADGTTTSSNATLTVVPVQTANVNFYRSAVQAEPSLVAYFPADGDTGSTLSNTSDSAHNATLEPNAEFDGRTARSFGVRALKLNGDGDATIPNNPAYEFANGNGTIEALVYLDKALAPGNETIFSMSSGASAVYYEIQATPDGSSLVYNNDSFTQPVNWAVPTSLLGRLAHVAIVFTNQTVTAFVDGVSLGTQANPSFGAETGLPGYIGSVSLSSPGVWTGTIDELAIYTSALSANTIAVHNSRFSYGTNVSAPSITSSPTGSKTLLAGGSPVFVVSASGTAPLAYQWLLNGKPITNATSSTLTLSQTTTNSSGAYSVTVSNPIGSTNSQPFTLAFVAPTDKYATMVMGDNPSAYWRLDETNGTTAFDSAGGHDGVYSGNLTLGAPGALPGISDTAVAFGGTTGVAKIPYSAALNPNGPFSIEFWANPLTHTPNGDTYTPMGSQFRNGSVRDGWAFYMENDGNGWELQMGYANGADIDAIGATADSPGRWDHIVAVYDGAGNLQLYVDGNVDATASGVYTPNGSAPWVIGQRNDGNFGFNGSIDEVAFYNYDLTADQILNHFGISYVASQVVTEPASVTNAAEPGTVTLTAVVSGFPNTYQWLLNGVALQPTANFDGTAHYPQGVTNATLVIAESDPADSGQYQLVVTNPLGGSQTVDVTVTVAPDRTRPTVAYVTAESDTNRVRVVFSKPVLPTTSTVAANYTFSGGVVAENVVPLTDSLTTVDVVTSGLKPGTKYTVTVAGVADTSSQTNLVVTGPVAFESYVLAKGVLAWDFYGNIPGTTVADLEADPQWPDGVYTNTTLTNFSTMQLTGGDLNNNPAFGSLGDNYGDHIYAWLTPAVTTNYTFFIRSDDNSELWLSTDNTQANGALIAYEPSCCNPFEEPGPTVTQTSTPIPLTAGQSYYIEAFHKEGGGGDYVEVAWRADGDTNAAANLRPIPGSFFSAYAPVPPAVFNQPTLANGQVTITWQGSGTLQETADFKTWTPVAGNPASGYTVTPTAGSALFYRLVQ
jgi:hypothetical protein